MPKHINIAVNEMVETTIAKATKEDEFFQNDYALGIKFKAKLWVMTGILAASSLSLMALVGCGQSGPLYLPESKPPIKVKVEKPCAR